MAAPMSSRRCLADSTTARTPAASGAPPRAGRPYLWAISSIAAPASPMFSVSAATWSPPGPRSPCLATTTFSSSDISAGQPVPIAHGLDSPRSPRSTRRPTGRRPRRRRALPDVPARPRRARPRQARRCACRTRGAFHLDPGDVAYQRAVYGVASGPLDAFDLDRRHPWLRRYRGAAVVVYGHTAIDRGRSGRDRRSTSTPAAATAEN